MRQYTYGPFNSRRLGLSLGVDILPKYKLCTFNCVYCEIGPTYQVVSPRDRIKAPPSSNYRKELKEILKFVPHLNSITFGYNGEPTLNDNLLDFFKITLDVRNELKWDKKPPLITLFTNSTTLYLEEIRNRVRHFDLVLAKLDAATNEDLRRTNRPHEDCPNIEIIVDSLIKLRKEMPEKKLAIQCLISKSYREDYISNNNKENIEQLAYVIKKINPNIVQLYSIARIPSEYYVFAIDEQRKKEIVKVFREIINNDLIEINYY
ncbi:MAG: radical SAM protein [Candidatus Lokiarchaeota archaeon]|nr:radical SAM protein [Candidatus Lokiarchaeota archaeon]